MLTDYANLLEENDRMKSELRMLRGGSAFSSLELIDVCNSKA